MDDMEKVRYMMEQIAEIIKKQFPTHSSCNLSLDPDGYRYISVTQWDKDGDVNDENQKRRSLFMQSKSNGVWHTESSNSYNNYLAQCGCLLREGK